MFSKKTFQKFSCLCMSLLLLSPAEAFPPIALNQESLNDLLAASIIGAVLGGVTHHAKQQHQKQQQQKQQQQQQNDNHGSAQHHHPMFVPMPWPLPSQPLPIHHHPMQHPIMPMMHPMPAAFHPMPAPMALMSHDIPPWVQQQMFAQMQQFQHPMMANQHAVIQPSSHPQVQELHAFGPVDARMPMQQVPMQQVPMQQMPMQQMPMHHPWVPMAAHVNPMFHQMEMNRHMMDQKLMPPN